MRESKKSEGGGGSSKSPPPPDRIGLKTIKLCKAAVIGGLFAEHFVCANNKISVHLSILFTARLSHGHMHYTLMKTAIVSILKNSQGDTSKKIIKIYCNCYGDVKNI